MRKLIPILTTAFVLGMLSCGLAQTVEIVAPAEVPEHTLVQVQTSESGTEYAWTVLGPRGEEQVAVFGRQAVFCGPPGRYAILQSWTTATGEKRQAFTFTTIIAGDDRETPDPFPPPPPEPVIEPGERWIVIIEETADRQSLTPGQLAMITSRELDPYCLQNGHRLRCYDQDAKNPAGNASTAVVPYLALLNTAGVPLPAVVILDAADNSTLFVGPLPNDSAAMIELLKSKGG
jgi:hypothetical protein